MSKPLAFEAEAQQVIDRCRRLATHTEVPGRITRRCLSAPMHLVHRDVQEWMTRLGMTSSIDAAGNLRGRRVSARASAPTLFIGSHLDTVPDAGAFDGIFGVLWALAVVEAVGRADLPMHIEVLGFSDEEGVRFGTPFLGSRALVGMLDDVLLQRPDPDGMTLREALVAFGADPADRDAAIAPADAIGYLECHIEQGPLLEHLDRPLGIVARIVGQTRVDVTFHGAARHAGTTPMHLRHDAVAGAAAWIVAVEHMARETPGLVATVGQVHAEPGAVNVIAGCCRVSLDVRHATDAVRVEAVARLRAMADEVARGRGLTVTWVEQLQQAAVEMDAAMTASLTRAVQASGYPIERMTSGAGHDAMVMATRMPTAMLFVRSPGGISHHPDETVRVEDVAASIAVGRALIMDLADLADSHA